MMSFFRLFEAIIVIAIKMWLIAQPWGRAARLLTSFLSLPADFDWSLFNAFLAFFIWVLEMTAQRWGRPQTHKGGSREETESHGGRREDPTPEENLCFDCFVAGHGQRTVRILECVHRTWYTWGLKNIYIWFWFPTDPVNLCATQIILWAWRRKN